MANIALECITRLMLVDEGSGVAARCVQDVVRCARGMASLDIVIRRTTVGLLTEVGLRGVVISDIVGISGMTDTLPIAQGEGNVTTVRVVANPTVENPTDAKAFVHIVKTAIEGRCVAAREATESVPMASVLTVIMPHGAEEIEVDVPSVITESLKENVTGATAWPDEVKLVTVMEVLEKVIMAEVIIRRNISG